MAYYRFSSTKFDQFDEKFFDSLWKMNINFQDEECDFFCLECSRMHSCVAYGEFKEEWESFYT